MLDSPLSTPSPGTLASEWTVFDERDAPLAYQHLEVALRALEKRMPADWSPAPILRSVHALALELGLEWSVSTWPTLIRPYTPRGRGLGVGSLQAGLLMVQEATDASGVATVRIETTLPSRRATTALVESLTVGAAR